MTPAGVVLRYRFTVVLLLAAFALLAVLATVDGGITVVLMLLVLLLLLVWYECRALALTLLAASAARPLVEWGLKELVDRTRPDLAQLVPGNGPSFPSGHVMAAVAVWGLLPPVVALVSGRRSAWWWSVAVSGTVIVLVAFSRVYLGVHWLSDVVGALVLGSLYLLVVEWLLDWHHRRRGCQELVDTDNGADGKQGRASSGRDVRRTTQDG